MGAAVGAAAIQSLHAQTKPPVYYVSEIEISDLDGWTKEYAPKAQALIRSMGGRVLASGQKVTSLEGDPPTIVIQGPTLIMGVRFGINL